jgi:hypothetical protein
MKRIITGERFSGEIIIENDQEGNLVLIDIREAGLSQTQLMWLWCDQSISCALPKLLNDITVKVTTVKEEITFDMFWKKYNDKERSSKKRTLTKWNRMRESEQVKAFNYIPKYFQSIPSGVEKKYAETYLNAELWNN